MPLQASARHVHRRLTAIPLGGAFLGLALAACRIGMVGTPAVGIPTVTLSPPEQAGVLPTPTIASPPQDSAGADPSPDAAAAVLSEIVPETKARDGDAEAWAPAAEGQVLGVGGQVQTLETGTARVDVADSLVRLAPNTLFTVQALSGDAESPVNEFLLTVGELWLAFTSALGGGSVTIETPVGVASVRGTYLGISYDQGTDSLIVSCLEGACGLRNEAGEVTLVAGQETHILRRGVRPEAPRPLDPERLARWQRFMPEAAGFVRQQGTRLAPTWLAPGFGATRQAVLTAVPRPRLTGLPDFLATARAQSTPPVGALATQRAGRTPTVPAILQTRQASRTRSP